jgi:hypothetical protein
VIIDGAADGEPKRRHDVYIFLQDFSKKKTLSIPVFCRFFRRKTDDILRTLLLMHDGISFGKILSKQVLFLGHALKPHCIQSSRVLVPAGTCKSPLRRHGSQAEPGSWRIKGSSQNYLRPQKSLPEPP